MGHRGRRRANAGAGRRMSRGFTLIELLVVIAIIALLLAVLLPRRAARRKQAKSVVCRSHLKQWGTTLALYLEDNEGRFPRAGANATWTASVAPERPVYRQRDRSQYALAGITACARRASPAVPWRTKGNGPRTFTSTANGELWMEGKTGLTFAPWEITKPGPPFRMSYGLNNNVFSPRFEGPGSSSPSAKHPYTDVFSVRNHDNIPLLLDAVGPSCSLMNERISPPAEEPSGSAGQLCINRHDGTINILFLDWSVGEIGLKGLWTLRWHLLFNTAGPWTKAGEVQPEDWPRWMRRFKDY